MHLTVIFSNRGDDDCSVLPLTWRNIPDTTVVEITPDMSDYEDLVDDAISREDDTLLLCGHGTTLGLLHPDYDRDAYLIHKNNVGLIHAKNVICCWCYAAEFCVNNHLKAFATSMFISNFGEAIDNCIYDVTQEHINSLGRLFYAQMNDLLVHEVPLNEWVMTLGIKVDIEDPVDTFNRQGLQYITE